MESDSDWFKPSYIWFINAINFLLTFISLLDGFALYLLFCYIFLIRFIYTTFNNSLIWNQISQIPHNSRRLMTFRCHFKGYIWCTSYLNKKVRLKSVSDNKKNCEWIFSFCLCLAFFFFIWDFIAKMLAYIGTME